MCKSRIRQRLRPEGRETAHSPRRRKQRIQLQKRQNKTCRYHLTPISVPAGRSANTFQRRDEERRRGRQVLPFWKRRRCRPRTFDAQWRSDRGSWRSRPRAPAQSHGVPSTRGRGRTGRTEHTPRCQAEPPNRPSITELRCSGKKWRLHGPGTPEAEHGERPGPGEAASRPRPARWLEGHENLGTCAIQCPVGKRRLSARRIKTQSQQFSL